MKFDAAVMVIIQEWEGGGWEGPRKGVELQKWRKEESWKLVF